MKDSVLSFPSGQSDMKPLYHSENRETPSMMYSGVKNLHMFSKFSPCAVFNISKISLILILLKMSIYLGVEGFTRPKEIEKN